MFSAVWRQGKNNIKLGVQGVLFQLMTLLLLKLKSLSTVLWVGLYVNVAHGRSEIKLTIKESAEVIRQKVFIRSNLIDVIRQK